MTKYPASTTKDIMISSFNTVSAASTGGGTFSTLIVTVGTEQVIDIYLSLIQASRDGGANNANHINIRISYPNGLSTTYAGGSFPTSPDFATPAIKLFPSASVFVEYTFAGSTSWNVKFVGVGYINN